MAVSGSELKKTQVFLYSLFPDEVTIDTKWLLRLKCLLDLFLQTFWISSINRSKWNLLFYMMNIRSRLQLFYKLHWFHRKDINLKIYTLKLQHADNALRPHMSACPWITWKLTPALIASISHFRWQGCSQICWSHWLVSELIRGNTYHTYHDKQYFQVSSVSIFSISSKQAIISCITWASFSA